ncbi:MAG: DUF4405 domain-containing protein [Nanoarchaeota archaeon]|nr:DUF4405 domain-containing protein [Nanoarchaeota archaeon]
MKRNMLNYVIDIGMGISFLLVFFTGIIKLPKILTFIIVNKIRLPLLTITLIHDWSGVVMGILVFAHIMLHWNWIVTMTKKLIKKGEK